MMSTTMPMKDAVLKVMEAASAAGRYPILYVKDANHFTMRPTDEAPVMFAYEHAGCAAELASTLHDMKEAGEWADKGGLWSWNLKSKAGAIIGGKGSRATTTNKAPTPVQDTSAQAKYDRAMNDLGKAQQEVQRLQTLVDDLVPQVEAERKAAKQRKADALKAALMLIQAAKDDPDYADLFAEEPAAPAEEPAPAA